MKTATIINTEKIEATEMSHEANIITLDSIPSVAQQAELLTDDSIVIEF